MGAASISSEAGSDRFASGLSVPELFLRVLRALRGEIIRRSRSCGKGWWPLDRFEILQGADNLTTYRFNTGVAKHTFCRTCGIHPFYTPRSHPDQIDVNVRCLDGNVIDRFTITPFDGRNWEASIVTLRAGEKSS